ncbi:MAG: hypothetical protein ABIU77_22340 [Ferruginibacter sp.]|jgi:Cu(I)/Ag(I) efflux system membrane fusion protein
MIEEGMETGDSIQIKSGLNAGDIIGTSGACLINNEYIFKNGANPIGGDKDVKISGGILEAFS